MAFKLEDYLSGDQKRGVWDWRKKLPAGGGFPFEPVAEGSPFEPAPDTRSPVLPNVRPRGRAPDTGPPAGPYYYPGVPGLEPPPAAASAAPAAGTAAPFDLNAFRSAYEQLVRGRSGTTEDWLSSVWPALQTQFPGLELFGSNQDKIRFPGGLGIFDAVLSAGAGGRGYNPFSLEQEGGGGPSEFDDPWGSAFERAINARLRSLGGGLDFPQLMEYINRLLGADVNKQANVEQLVGSMRGRAAELREPPYTSQQEAALKAGVIDPLERRRQETLRNAREQQYARGFEPTSGTVRERETGVNQMFEQARTGIESDLLRSGIDEQQRRRDQAVQLDQLIEQALSGGDLQSLQYLSQVGDIEQGLYKTREDRARESLSTYMLPLELMSQRQSQAAQAAGLGGSPQSLMGMISALLGLGQNQQALSLQSSRNNMAGLGQLLQLLMMGGGE